MVDFRWDNLVNTETRKVRQKEGERNWKRYKSKTENLVAERNGGGGWVYVFDLMKIEFNIKGRITTGQPQGI